jgi:hypothetical protein
VNSYLIFEDMKCEAMSEFKQSWPHHTMWSNMTEHKIRICVTFDQYSSILKLKGQKDISFTLKRENKFYTGFFDLKSVKGLSGWNNGRIIQLEISNLECDLAPKDFCRDMLLNEIL